MYFPKWFQQLCHTLEMGCRVNYAYQTKATRACAKASPATSHPKPDDISYETFSSGLLIDEAEFSINKTETHLYLIYILYLHIHN